MIKTCAGIVTYDPNISRLQNSYNSISKQVDFVIICDNGSKNISDICRLLKGKNDHIIKLDKNKGIAFALNSLCEYAYNKGYKWIITLDQDSVCPPQMIKALSRHCSDSTAIIGPMIIYKENEKYSAKSQKYFEKVDWIITSGSLTNTDIWKKIKGFDNAFFIDKVDTDYCIRANQAGYPVIRDNQVFLDHELGKLKCRKILGRVIYVTNHNELRIYYQIRNSIFLKKKNGYGNPLHDITKLSIKVLLFENDKILKIQNIIRGILDGIKYKKAE